MGTQNTLKHYISLLLICLITLTLNPTSNGQVSEVNKNIEKSKEQSGTTQTSHGTSDGSSGGDGFIVFLADIFINTIGAAQMAALENKHIYPERVSFFAGADMGYGFSRNTWNITTSARVNWGIFGSDFKYNSLTDITGQLNTIDWQVIVFRVPIQSFNLEYGFGFISVPNQAVSYSSNALGFDFKIRPIGTTFGSHYYWSSNTTLNTRFRTAFEVTSDIEVLTKGHFHLGILLKYSYQRFFEETDFNLASAGIIMKIY